MRQKERERERSLINISEPTRLLRNAHAVSCVKKKKKREKYTSPKIADVIL